MMDYTIAHEYRLPSEGRIYSQDVKADVTLRSMTTAEEMKRLNHSDKPYKVLSEIIDDCLVEKPGISVYDMCIADYQFLLHKLRIVTYGPQYKITSTCPYCGTVNQQTLNLDDQPVIPFDKEEYDRLSEIILPATEKKIKIKMQTPRIIDDITFRAKEQRRKNPSQVGDPAFLFTLEALIDKIDDVKPEQFRLQPFIQKLPMMDTNYLLQSAKKLNTLFGLDSVLAHTCTVCGLDYNSNFRTTSEFFGPSID